MYLNLPLPASLAAGGFCYHFCPCFGFAFSSFLSSFFSCSSPATDDSSSNHQKLQTNIFHSLSLSPPVLRWSIGCLVGGVFKVQQQMQSPPRPSSFTPLCVSLRLGLAKAQNERVGGLDKSPNRWLIGVGGLPSRSLNEQRPNPKISQAGGTLVDMDVLGFPPQL